jgi:hypothetical protein
MQKNIGTIEKEYLAEIAAIKEQNKARNIAQEIKLKNFNLTPERIAPEPESLPQPPAEWLEPKAKPAAKPEGWTGKTKDGFGWKEYEYRNADGSTVFIEKMAICKGWKCGKEFPHNYDCCQDCYNKPCTRCGQKFGNPYKPMCKKCFGETNATYGKWKKVKKQGYAFK